MKLRVLILAVIVSCLLFVTGQPAMWAQSGAGSIQGTVTDSTGGAMPGAAIHVVNVATGVPSDTKANGVGFYQVPALFTGHYAVTVSAPGMKTYETSIDLLVGQDAVINPVMTAGAVTQEIVVSGAAVQLTTTDNGAIASTLENARINQLPMNQRDLTTLVGNTTAGMSNNGYNINGLEPEALEYSVDGVTTQNNLYGGENLHNAQLADPDTVQEVRVEALDAGAKYETAGTVLVSTKSGTNSLHGSAFETARNNAIGVAKDRQDPSNYTAPHLVRNEFGASAGGPVILPHIYHGKDKTFWFFAYERYSLASTSVVLANVPTVAMSQGNFSGLTNGKGVLQTLYDPSTTKSSTNCAATASGKVTANAYCRTPFANNTIPISEEGPVAQLYYELAPLPTNASNPLVSTNLTAENPNFQVEPQITARLDHVFTENNRAYVRYTQNISGVNTSGGPRNRAADGIPVGAAVGNGGYNNSPTTTYLGGLGFTHIFSPTFFSETIASQQWFSQKKLPGAQALTPTVDYESMLGLPNNFGEVGFPAIGNGNLLFSLGSSQTNTAQEVQIVSTIDENLTKTVGKHQMEFGGRYRHQRQVDLPDLTADHQGISTLPTAVYQPSSAANYTALANTGYDDASFFIGAANNYTVNQQASFLHYHMMEFDGYFQDNYHFSRNLTFNIGLRYEAHPALWVKNGIANTFDLKNDAQVLDVPTATLIAEGYTTQSIITNMQNIGVKFETPDQAGMPSALLRNNDLDFMPRVGAAYQLFNGKYGTVVRGAYGRYSNPLPVEDFENHPANNNPFANTFTQSYATANQAIDALPNELIRYNDPVVFGVMGVNQANVVNTGQINSLLPGISLWDASPDIATPLVTETNFTIEQPLKGNSAFRVSWIWTHGTNLIMNDEYNNQPTNYQWEMATGTNPPTGGASVIGTPLQNTYAATAMGPYDQTTWGGNNMHMTRGWSNDNRLQADYQRIFHRGVAYQISYDFSKPMRAGGNTGGLQPATSNVLPYANYPGARGTVSTMNPVMGPVYAGVPPPALPSGLPYWADYHAMDKYQDYQIDSSEPIHHIRFSGVFDLPIGRGKRFFGNVNRFWDELIGGYQIAGDGNVNSQLFQVSNANWGPVNPVQVYKHKYPVTDCRSGVCLNSFLWFNGYLAPTVTTGVQGSTCTTNCISGLPSNYAPYQTPIDSSPTGTYAAYYGDNDVQISSPALLASNGGLPVTVAYDAGPKGSNYLQNSYFNGPFNYNEDISIFKVFPIKDGTYLRVNVDAFNAFNVQGWNNPGTLDGVENNLSSANTPRQIQITARFTF